MAQPAPSPPLPVCPMCGQTVPPDAPGGLCPRCLVAGGLSEAPAAVPGATSVDPDSTLHIVIPEDAALPADAPRKLGKYELLEEIARGGMGIIYKARHTGLDAIVAVKLIRSGLLATPTDVERFRREARAAAKLKHPNIVSVHDIGEENGQHYFSMDYVPGANLSELARMRPFSPKQSAEITRAVAVAIHYAHGQGVLHRDIKPSNVILTPEQVPRVLDFGLARIAADDSQLTQSGTPMGSPCYMPPEQCGFGEKEEVRRQKAEGRSRKTEARSELKVSHSTTIGNRQSAIANPT